MQPAAQEILKRIFKLAEFRPLQQEVIGHVLNGGSGLVLMPTGGGKSLTYQLPAMVFSQEKKNALTLVLSPLKALMRDQVTKLRALGVRASFINSDLKKEDREKRQAELSEGRYQILYVTPERFRKPEFVAAVKNVPLALIVVDEAHCVSQWGHDFRPEYAKVGEVRKTLGEPPVLALTATATPEAQKDIRSRLRIENDPVFKVAMVRPNLAIEVHDLFGLEPKIEQIEQQLQKNPGTSIVYTSLIKTLHQISNELQKKKIPHEVYHGDLDERQKRRAQDRFLTEDVLMLATPAFGLGIDKPNVRNVFHAELPGSLEAYFQEIGRAGRDGAQADCILLYDEQDVATQMEFIKWSSPEATFIQKVYHLIEKNPERVRQEGADFLREQMNFRNNHDYRVETVIQLLTASGSLEGWSVVGPVDPALIDEKLREEFLRTKNKKLLSLVQFVNSNECRQQLIYRYFSEDVPEPCGICDNCRAAE